MTADGTLRATVRRSSASHPASIERQIVLEPLDERDILELILPADTAVDEMPEPRRAETPFGSFSISWQVQNGRVTRNLSLRIHRSNVAPASYADVRTFLDTFREAERLPVILVKR